VQRSSLSLVHAGQARGIRTSLNGGEECDLSSTAEERYHPETFGRGVTDRVVVE
jgi:hypothetical protein